MIGILNEKPSQARNFAKALGGFSGTYNGEKYEIVAARGHLYGFIDDPSKQVGDDKEDIYKSWNVENLPWDEKDFKWIYAKKPDSSEVLKNIKNVLSKCDEIVIATDDDPTGEGELLAWEIISQLGIKANKYSRMFFSDESESEIQKAFKNRKILGNSLSCMYDDPDYKQALFRTKWDYLSMQWTRIASAYAPFGQVPRQGRLKSAMVKIVGDQLTAIEKYEKKPFYQVRFKDENGIMYINEEQERFSNKKEVSLDAFKSSSVVCDSVKTLYKAPPKFLDLATLGGLLAPKGISAQTVLSTYQKMYEAKVVSYPRTEDKCITIEQYKQLLPLVDKIAELLNVDKTLLTHRMPRKTHIKEGMAHGANRPGVEVPSSLEHLDEKYGAGARLIYETLARNYLATLCEDYEYEQQNGHVKDYPNFKGTTFLPKRKGWKLVYEEDDILEDNSNKLGSIGTPFIFEGVNAKPLQPTMKWLMKQLEKYDVGTGATRTSIYADITNSKSKYPLLKESKGKISMDKNGISSYKLLPGTLIGSLDLTEKIGRQMKEVYDGKTSGEEYLQEIQEMIRHDIKVMLNNKPSVLEYFEKVKQEKEVVGVCPLCGGEIVERDSFYGCSNWKAKNCHFSIHKEISGKKITKPVVKQLLSKGESGVLDGFKSKKTGKVFHAKLKLNSNGTLSFDFNIPVEDNSLGECPVCGKGVIIEKSNNYGCSNWKCGCKAVIWKNALEFRGKEKITKSEAKKLFAGKKVKVKLKRKADGKEYEAHASYNKETNKIEITL